MNTQQISSNVIVDRKNSMFEFIESNFKNKTSNTTIVLNCCNIRSNQYSRGYAAKLGEIYPLSITNYEMLSRSQRQLGHSQMVNVKHNKNLKNNIYIANMICQTSFNNKNSKDRIINYSAMNLCLLKIAGFIESLRKNDETDVFIYTHKYLINYFGQESKFINYLLEDTLRKYSVVIFNE